MTYVKTTWVDQDVERPKTYEVTNNADGSITLTDSFGIVTELGTPVNALNMNHIEDGIDDHETRITYLENQKELLNKLTNCILEAPNGVLTYSGSTLTAYSGLKVLIPNGRNTDNTLKNTVYTLSANATFTYTYSIAISKDLISITVNGNIERLQSEFVYIVDTYAQLSTSTGTNQYRWAYVKDDNKWYFTNDTGTTWTHFLACIVGFASIDASNVITDLTSYRAVKLVTADEFETKLDKDLFNLPTESRKTMSGFSMPSGVYDNLALGASGSTYTAPANGYFYITGGQADKQYFTMINITTGVAVNFAPSGENGVYGFLPVKQGDVMQANYNISGPVGAFRFYYAVGEV